MEIFFPHDKFLHGKFPKCNPLFPTPPPNQKIPLKTSVHFPITITVCKAFLNYGSRPQMGSRSETLGSREDSKLKYLNTGFYSIYAISVENWLISHQNVLFWWTLAGKFLNLLAGLNLG